MVAVSIIVGALIALFSGMGVGGGGLFAVYLAVFTDIPQLAVQGYNLLFFLFSAGASVTIQLFRRKIPFAAVGIMAAAGILGAFAGAFAGGLVPSEWLRRIFGIMLVSGGIVSLKKLTSEKYSEKCSTKTPSRQNKSTEKSEDKGEK